MEEATSTPTIKFDCPTCDQPLQIEAEAAGELITCPACGTTSAGKGIKTNATPSSRKA